MIKNIEGKKIEEDRNWVDKKKENRDKCIERIYVNKVRKETENKNIHIINWIEDIFHILGGMSNCKKILSVLSEWL